MGHFIRHDSCPACGSSNNLAVYSDGAFCHTPGCTNKKGSMITDTEKAQAPDLVSYSLPELGNAYDLAEFRGINPDVFDKYGVGQTEDAIYFPWYVDGKLYGAKKRLTGEGLWSQKKFFCEGNTKHVGLFGLNMYDRDLKKVIITEGELDALAAYQMVSRGYNVFSLAHGAEAADKQVLRHIDLLNKHDKIYLCFDNDKAGKVALDTVSKVFKPSKLRVVHLPHDYKDANDMLKAKQEKLFRDCVSDALEVTPPEIYSIADLIADSDRSFDESLFSGTTGYVGLDELIGGFTPGELITLVGGTGTGKTALTRQAVYNSMVAGRKCFFITLETKARVVLHQLMEMHLKRKIIGALDQFTFSKTAEFKAARQWVMERCIFANILGSLSIEKCCHLIETVKYAYGVDFVALDHLTAAVNTGLDNGVKATDFYIAELNRIATQENVFILCISHQSRSEDDKDDTKTALNRVRFSQGIAHNSHCVLGIERQRDSNVCTIRTLKAHRIIGYYGECQLTFNQLTRTYYEDAPATNPRIDKPVETEEQVQLEVSRYDSPNGNHAEGQQEEGEKPVREVHSRVESILGVRTSEAELSTHLRSRLQIHHDFRKDHLCGSKGTSISERTRQAFGNSEVEPVPISTIAYSTLAYLDKSPILKALPHLGAMVDASRVCMERRRKNSAKLVGGIDGVTQQETIEEDGSN